jgi:hypothetical protein
LLKQDPSAQRPCAKTMLGFFSVIVLSSNRFVCARICEFQAGCFSFGTLTKTL